MSSWPLLQVWESTVLLAVCSDDELPAGCLFGREDTHKLLPEDLRVSVFS